MSSKYLTPCRTFGLSRKSMPKEEPRSREKRKKEEQDPEQKTEAEVVTPKGIGSVGSTKRRRKSLEGTPVSKGGLRKRLSLSHRQEPEDEETKVLVETIKARQKKLESLKRMKLYTQKHDVTKLRQSTDSWRRVFQEAFSVLLEEMKARSPDQNESLETLAQALNIPEDLLQS